MAETVRNNSRADVTCSTLRTVAEIEEISSEWNHLLARSPCNRAFSSPAWHIAALKAHPELTPSAMVARRDGMLSAVLPVAMEADGNTAIFPSKMSNYNDLVAECEDAAAAIELAEYAIAGERPYARLSLSWTRRGSALVRALQSMSSRFDTQDYFVADREYSYVQLPQLYDEYLKTRSRMFRKGLGRAVRKAAAAGLEVRELLPGDFPNGDPADIFLRLHLLRFGAESAFSRLPANAILVRLALREMLAQRQMKIFGVLRGAEILAIDLSMAGANSLCTWNGGYAPESECWSPGRLLMDAGLRAAIASGLAEYDLLRGMQEWKAAWSNCVRLVGRVEIETGKVKFR